MTNLLLQELTTFTKIDFNRHFHPEFEGWLFANKNICYISLIFAKKDKKGKGFFSKLLKELKENYDIIRIPEPSDQMREIVINKGFVPIFKWDENIYESIFMMEWRKEQ